MDQHPPPITIVISLDDLEALEIAKLAESEGAVTLVTLDRGWGRRPDVAEPVIPDVGPILAVECPNPSWEAKLAAIGRTVHQIDHHLYVGIGDSRIEDRRHPLASIE